MDAGLASLAVAGPRGATGKSSHARPHAPRLRVGGWGVKRNGAGRVGASMMRIVSRAGRRGSRGGRAQGSANGGETFPDLYRAVNVIYAGLNSWQLYFDPCTPFT